MQIINNVVMFENKEDIEDLDYDKLVFNDKTLLVYKIDRDQYVIIEPQESGRAIIGIKKLYQIYKTKERDEYIAKFIGINIPEVIVEKTIYKEKPEFDKSPVWL